MVTALNLSKPEDARTYIKIFREVYLDCDHVCFSSGRKVELDNMTDEEAVVVACGLYEMEFAAQNGGIQ